ncbi:MAG: polysaccharide deacetylase family protein [Bacteroidales bacterium]|nr:polysaccharide deacetylase family protein [Bacteroidales bacterium]
MQRSTLFLLSVVAMLAGCSRLPDPEPVDNPRVVILMYHRITEGEAGNLYERSAADFGMDLKYLKDNNIMVIDFAELEEIVSGKTELLTHAAVITFDDGDHSWYTLAVPLLKKYRMKGTFFLWASQIGMDSFLSWDEVERMSNHAYDGGVRPFTFGSHTLYHRFLMTMKAALGGGDAFAAYLDEELGGSKILIDKHITGRVEALALPFGDGAGDPDIIAAAIRHGYRFIRTSERNVTGTSATDLLRLPSLPMLDDTPQELIGNYLGIE